MAFRSRFIIGVWIVIFLSSCSGTTIQEIITCNPGQADIYWGKTPSSMVESGLKTPLSRVISASTWEPYCYQVKKEGYHDSRTVCREEEGYRLLEFRLEPIKTTITSDPPGAVLYWGPTMEEIGRTLHRTPLSLSDDSGGPNWKAGYFQVRKDGYIDSEIVLLSQQPIDRDYRFKLYPNPLKAGISNAGVSLSWKDNSFDELGYAVERKKGSMGIFKEIGRVGPNVTSFTDTDIASNCTYYYRVRSFSATGYSTYSEDTQVRTHQE